MRAEATTVAPQPDLAQAQAAQAQAAQAQAAQAQAATEAAAGRVAAEIAQARAAAASIERAAQAQGGPGGVRITTSADGRTTTISEPGGKQTIITTEPDGRVSIVENGRPTATLPAGLPWTEAIQRLTERTQAITEVQPAPPPFPREQIPDGVVPLVGILFGMIVAMIVGLPIARAFARRMDRKSAVAAPAPELGTRLDRIEQAIEAIAVEVERVSEAQRYSARLLTERLPESPARAIAAEHAR